MQQLIGRDGVPVDGQLLQLEQLEGAAAVGQLREAAPPRAVARLRRQRLRRQTARERTAAAAVRAC